MILRRWLLGLLIRGHLFTHNLLFIILVAGRTSVVVFQDVLDVANLLKIQSALLQEALYQVEIFVDWLTFDGLACMVKNDMSYLTKEFPIEEWFVKFVVLLTTVQIPKMIQSELFLLIVSSAMSGSLLF